MRLRVEASGRPGFQNRQWLGSGRRKQNDAVGIKPLQAAGTQGAEACVQQESEIGGGRHRLTKDLAPSALQNLQIASRQAERTANDVVVRREVDVRLDVVKLQKDWNNRIPNWTHHEQVVANLRPRSYVSISPVLGDGWVLAGVEQIELVVVGEDVETESIFRHGSESRRTTPPRGQLTKSQYARATTVTIPQSIWTVLVIRKAVRWSRADGGSEERMNMELRAQAHPT